MHFQFEFAFENAFDKYQLEREELFKMKNVQTTTESPPTNYQALNISTGFNMITNYDDTSHAQWSNLSKLIRS